MIEVLKKAAKAGGKILQKYQNQKLVVKEKGDFRMLVTRADTLSQEAISQTIISELVKKGISQEKIGFIGEESLNIAGEHLFVIDPLDGTNNYLISFPYTAVSIAHFHNQVLTDALVYHPSEETFYFASPNRGAFYECRGRKNKLTIKYKDLKEMVPGVFLIEDQFKILSYFDDKILADRSIGSIVLDLCLFARGVFGAAIIGSSFIWDIAAAKLIVEEAGGKVVDWMGKPISFDFANSQKRYQLIAAHPKNISALVDGIRKSYQGE